MVSEERRQRVLEDLQRVKAELGKIIVSSLVKSEIGELIKEGATKMPVKVIRQAIREEFMAQSKFWDDSYIDDVAIDAPYFYEVEALD